MSQSRFTVRDLMAALARLPADAEVAVQGGLSLREVVLLAIHLQEDPRQLQKQVGGPAHGLFQFERGGGVRGVLEHRASRLHALSVCAALGITPTAEAVYQALRHGDDRLDAAFARLLLWTEAPPLPAVGDVEGGFRYYLSAWRPGAHARGNATQRAALRRKWGLGYARAMDAVREAACSIC